MPCERRRGWSRRGFPVPAFVGMISDEIEQLRRLGRTDEEIAAMVRENSGIEINAAEIEQFYASPEDRHGPPR